MSGPRMHTLAAMLVEKLRRHRPSAVAIGISLRDDAHVTVRLSPVEEAERNAASLSRAERSVARAERNAASKRRNKAKKGGRK